MSLNRSSAGLLLERLEDRNSPSAWSVGIAQCVQLVNNQLTQETAQYQQLVNQGGFVQQWFALNGNQPLVPGGPQAQYFQPQYYGQIGQDDLQIHSEINQFATAVSYLYVNGFLDSGDKSTAIVAWGQMQQISQQADYYFLAYAEQVNASSAAAN